MCKYAPRPDLWQAIQERREQPVSHIIVRQIVSKKYPFAGLDWYYDFGETIQSADFAALNRFIISKQEHFAALAKRWDDAKNTEWVCRILCASKMILAASVMLQSLRYSHENNLRICIPYLQYYSVLYSLRALILVMPSEQWKGGKLIEQTHTKTINIACQEVSKVLPEWVTPNTGDISVKQRVMRLKAFREFISYRAPSSGDALGKYNVDVHSICRVPVEIAQMVSVR